MFRTLQCADPGDADTQQFGGALDGEIGQGFLLVAVTQMLQDLALDLLAAAGGGIANSVEVIDHVGYEYQARRRFWIV